MWVLFYCPISQRNLMKPRFSSLCCPPGFIGWLCDRGHTLEFVSGKKWGPTALRFLRSLDLTSMAPLSLKTRAQRPIKTAHIYLDMDHPCMNVDWGVFRSDLLLYKSMFNKKCIWHKFRFGFKTLPEAQRTQGIASLTWLISQARNLATRWRHLH